ncbi:GNAT family N-acetyltransferase [Inquilinus sp. Marseille-Q2685]|uniref:GNAT family N-acetyltransferase n=1 Tax=Inquilinus sp. Marseille-Q2685 TaxID=2866581 RepID=UPI001CE3F4C9|nr:GNAT family N-acetyltransferase [Inquilinus sp. Marseille-Q2685]
MDAIPIPQPGTTFLSYASTRAPVTTSRQGDSLTVRQAGAAPLTLRLTEGRLSVTGAGSGDAALRGVCAAIEAAFGWHPGWERLTLDLGDGATELADVLRRRGVAVETADAPLTVLPELFMQQADLWHGRPDLPAFPQRHVMTDGKRHPQRPPKPQGIVYARWIPWLEQTIAFRAATVEDDLGHLHKWMNDPRVAAFWNEDGDLEKHRRYLSGLIADPHMVPLIATFDGVPFAYFEIYWARENRLAPFYDVQDYDRGWHVVVGEDAYRGRAFISAWLPSLTHYMLLDDCRTQRIVGEPAAAHHQQIRNLETSGFVRIKTFDFPHKRAALVMLLRERFFFDRLWLPAAPAAQPVLSR